MLARSPSRAVASRLAVELAGPGAPPMPTLPRDRGVITALIPLCGRLIRLLVSIPCGPDGHWFSLGYGNFQKAL